MCTNCTCLMHSCNYVVFEKFTCAYYHQIVLKSYYPNRIPLKCCMDYMQLHELELQRFHFVECDLGSAVNCLIMQPGQFAGTCIYHVEFGWVMFAFSLQNAFHYFSEYIQSDSEFWVVYYALIPLWKKHISKKDKTKQKRGKKTVDYFLNYPANWYVLNSFFTVTRQWI